MERPRSLAPLLAGAFAWGGEAIRCSIAAYQRVAGDGLVPAAEPRKKGSDGLIQAPWFRPMSHSITHPLHQGIKANRVDSAKDGLIPSQGFACKKNFSEELL